MMVNRGSTATVVQSYLFLNPLIDKESMYSNSMKLIRVAKKVINLNIKKPKSFRLVAIQVCPHVVNTLLQPPTLQTAEQIIETMAIFDTVSIFAQISVVMYGVMNKKNIPVP